MSHFAFASTNWPLLYSITNYASDPDVGSDNIPISPSQFYCGYYNGTLSIYLVNNETSNSQNFQSHSPFTNGGYGILQTLFGQGQGGYANPALTGTYSIYQMPSSYYNVGGVCPSSPPSIYASVGVFYWNGLIPVPPITDTSTRFITTYPNNGTTTATTSPVGAKVYVNASTTEFAGAGYARLHVHIIQDGAFACMNSGAIYDAVVTCSGINAPAPPIDIDLSTSTAGKLITGQYDLSLPVTFGGPGKWDATYTIENVSFPWYELGIVPNYTVVISTTTQFTIGSLSPIDIAKTAVASATQAINVLTQQGIGAILASTTAQFGSACNPIGGAFSAGDCITLALWPGQQAVADDFTILKELPPWGYVFRFIDILNATTSTTTLPTVSYTLATSSPLYQAGLTQIAFDPLGALVQSGQLVNEMKSDQATPMTLWQIVMPAVNIIVYLALIFMIIKDLTNVHKHDDGGGKFKDRNKNI